MRGALFFAALGCALLALHYAPIHTVACNGLSCELSDGSFRLDPRNSKRFYP